MKKIDIDALIDELHVVRETMRSTRIKGMKAEGRHKAINALSLAILVLVRLKCLQNKYMEKEK